jgi:hypothetical protein
MNRQHLRTQDRDSLARFLGWFSIGLGSAQLAAPRTLCRVVGSDGEGKAALVMRAMGLRELAHGTGILVRPRPTGWVLSRVVGDAIDLAALLGLAARNRRARTLFAIANVVPIAAADYYETRRLAQKEGPPQSGKSIRKTVTINDSRERVEAAWVEAAELRRKVDERGASVSFLEAPGNRGTELAVDFVFDPPAGEFGVAVAKLTGRDLATQLADDLRRFKARIETGQVVRSDSTPSGHLLADHLRQRAAQPLEEVPR